MAVMRKTPEGTLMANGYENRDGSMKGVFLAIHKRDDVAYLEYHEGEGLSLILVDESLQKCDIKLKRYRTWDEYWADTNR